MLESEKIMRATILLAALVFAPALTFAQQPCMSHADSAVDAIYRQVLERPAGGEGNARAEQLRNGQTSVREIVRDIAQSPEHLQRFLPANNRTEAVTNLYRHLLGRAPDPEGLNSHVQGRDSLAALVDTFINSTEYQQKFGVNTVPGGTTRYCRDASSSAANSSRIRFQNMDRNGNRVIEREEWDGSRGSFEVHDWNRDGVLSGEEVQTGARRAARAEEDFDPTMAATWTEDAFRQADRNRDGRITSSEWFYNAEYFRRADRNRDGALTVAEFTSTSMDDDRDDRFENLDFNRNGRLERNEWHGSADAFEWLDRNNDNVLSRAEVVGEDSGQFDSFASLDTNRSGTLTPDEWKWTTRSFNRYDTNGDGTLTRREFNAGGGAPAESR
jgi:Ca2+-binding EF-hand superfamily protein